jgi:hypothetical protein
MNILSCLSESLELLTLARALVSGASQECDAEMPPIHESPAQVPSTSEHIDRKTARVSGAV